MQYLHTRSSKLICKDVCDNSDCQDSLYELIHKSIFRLERLTTQINENDCIYFNSKDRVRMYIEEDEQPDQSLNILYEIKSIHHVYLYLLGFAYT